MMWCMLLLPAVAATLLSLASANTEDCTPQRQRIIQCRLYNSTDSCAAAANITTDRPGIPAVKQLRTNVARAGAEHTKIVITWMPTSPASLNETVGYVLRLYYMNRTGVKKLLLCRYHKVWIIAYQAQTRNMGAVFSYTVSALEHMDAEIVAEVEALPTSTRGTPLLANKIFRTYEPIVTSVTAATSIKPRSNRLPEGRNNSIEQNPMNITFDVSIPYSVTAKFRRTSYYDDIDVLYNHRRYRVVLLDNNMYYMRDFLSKAIKTECINRSKVGEYATVTYTHLIPATYIFEVRPCDCMCKSCCDLIKPSQIEHKKVIVLGVDYNPPRPPQISISDMNAVTVKFNAAPSSHFVRSYKVSLQTPDRRTLISKKVLPANTSNWHIENVLFTSEEVNTLFSIGDKIQAKVVPTVISALCVEPGACNLNGSCNSCMESISRYATVNKSPTNLVAVAISMTIVLLLIAVVLVWCAWTRGCFKRRQQLVKRVETPEIRISNNTDVMSGNTQSMPTFSEELSRNTDETSRMFMGVELIICVTFAATQETTPHYERLCVTLSEILGRFFSCRVVPYTEICKRGSNIFSHCQFLLVLCSSELCSINKHLSRNKHPPKSVCQEWMQCYEIRELLRLDKPTPILATFPHIPSKCIKELQNSCGKGKRDVYKLPDQFENLAAGLYSNDSTNTKITTWTEYKRSSLSTRLALEIKELVAACRNSPSISLPADSGLGETMSLQSVRSVTTQGQLRRLNSEEGYVTDAPSVQPLVRQRSVADSPERRDTTSPHALEMYYLRQNSDDLNPNPKHSQQHGATSQQPSDSPPSTDPQDLPNHLLHEMLLRPQFLHTPNNPPLPHSQHSPAVESESCYTVCDSQRLRNTTDV